MKLTEHFTLDELTRSTTAQRLGVANTPPQELLPRLVRTAEMLERIRSTVGVPIVVTSGYRCERVERELTYSAYLARCRRQGIPVNDETWRDYFETKDHPRGHAADILAPRFGTPTEVARLLAPLVSVLDIGQLILEGVKGKQWVHVSTHTPEKAINRVITITDAGTVPGIVGLS